MKENKNKINLVSACWLLTSKCNYRCSFCFKVTTDKELNFDEAAKILRDLVETGVNKISFSGGEPLLWSGNTIRLIKLAKSYKLLTMIITNGSLLTDDNLKKLEGSLDWITLPVDGSSEERQVRTGRPFGHLFRVIKLLKRLKNSQFSIKINTVVSKQNIDDLENIAKLIKKYKVKRWKLFQFYPIRDASLINREKHEISEEEFRGVEAKVRPLLNRANCLVYFGSNQDLDESYFTIAPNGIVYASKNGKDILLGDLKIKKAKEIWNKTSLIDKTKYWERSTWFVD